MTWQACPYSAPLLVLAAAYACLSHYGWRRRRRPGAGPFTLLCAAGGWWAAGLALHHAGGDVPTQLFWLRMTFMGIHLVPATWLWLALTYTGHPRLQTARMVASLAVVPVLTQGVLWTNERHHLYWRRVAPDDSAGFLCVDRTVGPWFWFYTGYSFLLLLVGSLLIVHALARSPRVYRMQAQSVLLAVAAPWAANVLYVWDVTPFPFLDPTPFAMLLAFSALGFALFRFGLLDLRPVAREKAVEGMADGFLVLDAQDRLVEANPAARGAVGDALGRTTAEILPEIAARLPEAASGGEIERGGRTWEPRLSALRGDDGERAGTLVVLRDVTERKVAEAALRRQNRYLEALLESSRVIASGLDLDAVLRNIAFEGARLVVGVPGGIGLVRGGRVVFEHFWLGDHWEKTDRSFALGEGVAGRVAEDGRSIVADVASDPDIATLEGLLSLGIAGTLAVPILDRGARVSGVLVVGRTATDAPFGDDELRLVEALARQAAVAIENAALYGQNAESLRAIEVLYASEKQLTRRLRELDVMKTHFMIVTSHEMRTPLTLLAGYLDALHLGMLGPLTPAQEKAVAIGLRTVRRMGASFNDILQMLQMGEGRLPLARQRVELGELVRAVLDELAPLLERRRIVSALAGAPDLPPIDADPGRLRQVLLNLVQNAMKFTPDGGEVTVRVEARPGVVRIAVQDTGIGIEPDDLEKIFDPFYAGPDPLHHHSGTFEFEARGAGLGLALARGHVEAHGGRIWAESGGKGRGSLFVVELPTALEAPPAATGA